MAKPAPPVKARLVAGRSGSIQDEWRSVRPVQRGIEMAIAWLDGEKLSVEKIMERFGISERLAANNRRLLLESLKKRKAKAASRRAQGFQPRSAEGSTPSAASKD